MLVNKQYANAQELVGNLKNEGLADAMGKRPPVAEQKSYGYAI